MLRFIYDIMELGVGNMKPKPMDFSAKPRKRNQYFILIIDHQRTSQQASKRLRVLA